MSAISREKGALFCPVHPKKKLSFLCKQCNILICNKCIIKEHLGHPVEEIEDVAEKTYRKIDDFITKSEEILPKAKLNIKQVEAQVIARVQELEAGIEKAYQHEKYLIELVKENTHKTVSELKGEIQTINQQLSQFKSESDTYLDNLKSKVNECNDTKKTENDILLIDVIGGFDIFAENPPNCEFLSTKNKFMPGSNAPDDIENAFGCVSNADDQASVGSLYTDEKKHQGLDFKGAAAPIKDRQLLSQPKVNHYKDLPSLFPHSIKKFSDGTLCYCCLNKPYVYWVDQSYEIKKIHLDENVSDIAIHPTTDVLYVTCYNDSSIMTVDIHEGTLSFVFDTKDKPTCMAFKEDGTLLVGFYEQNKVVQYTPAGSVMISFNVTKPRHISVCDVTGNIVIVRKSSAPPRIVNKDFRNMFVYTQQQQAIHCRDAVFDIEGHLLIADHYNGQVHVVDAATQKDLKTITFDKTKLIYSICILEDGQLVVGTTGVYDDSYKLVFVTYM